MTTPSQQEIDNIKNEIECRLKRNNSKQSDREFYIGACYDASEITLELLHQYGYNKYKKGVCWINEVDHCVVYEDLKYDGDRPYYSGVIDMTAVQFHGEEGLEDYHQEFCKYKYGKIPDHHSQKHYKVKKEDLT
ncbi:hypothetical protein [Desertibacillus haloalkaliphilus]|uniref:hypothetical protein n=1 Tax=Desertibacillus haloalkaliphilus TaxID=1328930 RepID=UPI001C25DE25|nr:hypothetical protein [Desertibacillus haloalkaliphilus]